MQRKRQTCLSSAVEVVEITFGEVLLQYHYWDIVTKQPMSHSSKRAKQRVLVMAYKKILALIGPTGGVPGGGLVRVILADSNGGFCRAPSLVTSLLRKQ